MRSAKPSTPKSRSSRNCITSTWWRASASIAPIRSAPRLAGRPRFFSYHPDGVPAVGAAGMRAGAAAEDPQGTRLQRAHLFTMRWRWAETYFLRVSCVDGNGMFPPASPVLVAVQSPVDHPAERLALDYIARFEALRGAGQRALRSARTHGDAGTPLEQRGADRAEGWPPLARRNFAPRCAMRWKPTRWNLRILYGCSQHERRGSPRTRSTGACDGRNQEREVGLSAALNVRRMPPIGHPRGPGSTDTAIYGLLIMSHRHHTVTTRITRTTNRCSCIAIRTACSKS